MIYTISNDFLTVKINSLGAELYSIFSCENIEYLWQGDPAFWPKRAPILFPLPGRCVDNITFFDGKAYPMQPHGFINKQEFECCEQGENHLTLRASANEETFKSYPFDFSLEIRFSVEGNVLLQEFVICNPNKTGMPFGIGGHMGFYCPLFKDERFEDYNIQFLNKRKASPSILTRDEQVRILPQDDFCLHHDCFQEGARIYEAVSSNEVLLLGKRKKGVRVWFENMPLVAIWTSKKFKSPPYLCIEPWSGMSNKQVAESIPFLKHTALNHLPAGECCTKRIGIEII